MDSNTIVSLYIPRMNVMYTKEMVENVFDTLFTGIKITRIDFVPIINDTDNSVNKNYRSAFVHMYMQCRSKLKELYNTVFIQGLGYQLVLNGIDSYWFLLNNKNPIPETELNISQVVENARLLEERVIKQQEIIEYQSKKIKNIENVVYQLLGGLFNQSTQENTLEFYLDALDDRIHTMYDQDKCKWEDTPTTRQGDYCEKRIKKLEKELNTLKELAYQKVENDENSTHSSMPELVSISDKDQDEDEDEDNHSICSYSTHSSMPSLVESVNDESDNSREKRIRFSDELCGNN